MQSTAVTQQLVQATMSQNRSLLPNDLQASTRVLTNVIEILENNGNATDMVITVFAQDRTKYYDAVSLNFRLLMV